MTSDNNNSVRADDSKPLLGLVGLAMVTLVAAVGLSGMAVGIFPGLSRAVAPILCPADTASTRVVLDVHRSGGKTSTSPHIVCTHTSGRMVRVGPGSVFLGQTAALWVVFAALALSRRFWKRSR